jgi:hypothetical protein
MKKLVCLSFALICFFNTLQAQWIQTNGPYGGTIQCFAFNGNYIFAGTWGGGVFVSNDNRGNWSAANQGLTTLFIEAMAVCR